MKFKTNFIILPVLLTTLVTSCAHNTTVNHIEISPSKQILNDIYTEETFHAFTLRISATKPQIPPDLSDVMYSDCRDACDELSSIGIMGLPALLDYLTKQEDDDSKFYNNGFLFSVSCALLRINFQNISCSVDEYRYSSSALSRYFLLADANCSQIINSKSPVYEKISALRHFGILALPYVIKEIEKGNTEYEAYFTAIGLHMETPEFMTYMTDFSMSWEERFEKEGFMDGAEDFDYKVWLGENEEDLDNLFKFLDAYCAEYETVTTQ